MEINKTLNLLYKVEEYLEYDETKLGLEVGLFINELQLLNKKKDMYTFDQIIKQINQLDEYQKKQLAIILISETLNPKAIDNTIKIVQARNKKGML